MQKLVNGELIDLTVEEIAVIAAQADLAQKEQLQQQVKEIKRVKEREEFRFRNTLIKITEDEYVDMILSATTLRMMNVADRPQTVIVRINQKLIEMTLDNFFAACIEIARRKRLNLTAEKRVREGLESGTYTTKEEAIAAYEAIIKPS